MNISIRKMRPDDVDSVYNLEQEIFKDSWSYVLLSSETDGEEYKKPFVLEVNGKLAGYTFVWTIADEVHINNFAIHPSFRRKGLGLKLISFIFDEFQEYKKYFLEVRKSNKAAINLYQKSGFEVVFTRIKYYADGEDALVMQKFLK
jgi:ribosomal-protein-alanine N-acetyltransferase